MRAQVAVVAGAIANKYRKGGEAWVRLSWALGLREFGFDVYLVERLEPDVEDPHDGARVGYFLDVARRFGFEGRAALLVGDAAAGLGPGELRDVLADADLLINFSGHLALDSPAGKARHKIYVDVDPGYTQLWHAEGIDVGLDGHDAYVTLGLAVGSAGCAIPTLGLPWLATLPPVVLPQWPVTPVPVDRRYTTVGSWRGGYGRVEHAGVLYGQKAHEFRKVVDLPRLTRHRFELALSLDEADAADRVALRAAGWELTDPDEVCGSPAEYRAYIQNSAAEFSVAQGIYVDTGSGWFSDRTAHYLASGRPALVQDTGLGDLLPTGAGLVTFRTLDEAASAADAVMADYEPHAAAARAFAERYLDAGVVLARVLEQSPPKTTARPPHVPRPAIAQGATA